MRFMITSTNDAGSDTNAPISDELFAAYMKFNEDLHTAGVLVAAEGLTPGTPGARVVASAGKRKVVDGPFAESKELVAGFWILEVSGLEEAVEWARRAPNPQPGGSATLEVRRVVEAEDLGDAFAPEARAAEERMRARLAELD